MSESKKTKIWKCNNCNTYFTPIPPNFSCPNCNGNATTPTKDQVDESQVWRGREPVETINCAKCNTPMIRGFTVQSDELGQLLTLGGGIYWCPDEAGFITDRIALKAYACPNCGYLETYIRYNKQRELLHNKLLKLVTN